MLFTHVHAIHHLMEAVTPSRITRVEWWFNYNGRASDFDVVTEENERVTLSLLHDAPKEPA